MRSTGASTALANLARHLLSCGDIQTQELEVVTSTRKSLIFIFVTRILDSIGFGIVMPVLPKLLLSMGASDVAAATRIAGWLSVTYATLQFFSGPIIGNLSDRFGRRPVILISLFAYGFDYLLTGFAPTIAWLFAGRAIAGIAGAVYVPANAFVADVTPPEQRARAFGIVSAAFGLGFIIGPGVGGWLGELGSRAPFFAAGGLAILNFLFGIFVLPESLTVERRRAFSWTRANPLSVVESLNKYPAVLLYAAVVTALLIATSVYPSTWAFFTWTTFKWSTGMIGLSLVATGTAMALVQGGLVGAAVKRLGEVRTAIVGLTVAVCTGLANAFVSDARVLFAVIVAGSLQTMALPALNGLMSRSVPPSAQGELQGCVASLASIANIVGPFVMTQTMAFFTRPDTLVFFPGAAFLVAALVNLMGLVLLACRSMRGSLKGTFVEGS
jgi:DHA1 family tetracycline resistance protein-like MFS transporter